jgi:hypothetical protein
MEMDEKKKKKSRKTVGGEEMEREYDIDEMMKERKE